MARSVLTARQYPMGDPVLPRPMSVLPRPMSVLSRHMSVLPWDQPHWRRCRKL